MKCELSDCLRECEDGHYDAIPMCTACYVIERLLHDDVTGASDSIFSTSLYIKDRCATVGRSIK